MLVRALHSDWAVLSEEIGLWIPAEVVNKEHDDKPEGAEELGNLFSVPLNPHIPISHTKKAQFLFSGFRKLKITWHLSARFIECIVHIFFFVGWRSIISLTKVYFLLQRIKFYLVGQYHRNAMLNFIQIMMVELLDGALLTIKKVQLTAVKLAWITLNVPSQVIKNVTYGFIARLRKVAILQIYTNTNIKSAGSNM